MLWCKRIKTETLRTIYLFVSISETQDLLLYANPTSLVGTPSTTRSVGILSITSTVGSPSTTSFLGILPCHIYFYFRGAKICINSYRIPGFASLLQTHLVRGSVKSFAQLAIGHSQRGNPWLAIGQSQRGDPCMLFLGPDIGHSYVILPSKLSTVDLVRLVVQ